ncbi:MAG: hypothetical protein QN159_03345 [Armatimonadota bacterium]|nr:hypothetical protein [Armatimonadota bacterium]
MARAMGSAGGRASAARPRAVLRLWGMGDVPASALLEAAEEVRRALGTLGVAEVSIEVVPEDDEAPQPAAVLVS